MHICSQEFDFMLMVFSQDVRVTFAIVKLWIRTLVK